MTTILAVVFGAVIAGVATGIAQAAKQNVTVFHWGVNVVLGALGAVAANQLLPGAYGPVVANLSLVPMFVGSLVLAGIGTWCVNHLSK